MSSVLQEGLIEMKADEVEEIISSCVFDMCEARNDVTVALCPTAEQLAQRCQEDFSVSITQWRSHNFCRESPPLPLPLTPAPLPLTPALTPVTPPASSRIHEALGGTFRLFSQKSLRRFSERHYDLLAPPITKVTCVV